jgi:hypothetical protein
MSLAGTRLPVLAGCILLVLYLGGRPPHATGQPIRIPPLRAHDQPVKIQSLVSSASPLQLTETQEVKRTPFGRAESMPVHVGMELASGDILASETGRVVLQLLCPQGSPVVLTRRFRVVILDSKKACALSLLDGSAHVLAVEPTQVNAAGAVAGSPRTVYAVHIHDSDSAAAAQFVVFEGSLRIATDAAASKTREVATGAEVRYEDAVLSEDESISDYDFRLSAGAYAGIEASQVAASLAERDRIRLRLQGFYLDVLRHPHDPEPWDRLRAAQNDYGLSAAERLTATLRSRALQRLPERTLEEAGDHPATSSGTGKGPQPKPEIKAEISPPAASPATDEKARVLLVARLGSGSPTDQVSRIPPHQSQGEVVHPGMELADGETLQSSSRDVVIQVACPRGALASLSQEFRARIRLSHARCGFELLAGNVDLLGNAPTEVTFGNLSITATDAAYSVWFDDPGPQRLASRKVPVQPRVLAFDGLVELVEHAPFRRMLTAGREARYDVIGQDRFRETTAQPGMWDGIGGPPQSPVGSPIADDALRASADLRAFVATAKLDPEHRTSPREQLSAELAALELGVLRNPGSGDDRAALGLRQADLGLQREAMFNLRRCQFLDLHVRLHADIDRDSDWVSADGDMTSSGYHALAVILLDRATALGDSALKAQSAAERALARDARDSRLSAAQRLDCREIAAGRGARATSSDYCDAAALQLRGDLAQLMAVEGLRRNEIDRGLQAPSYAHCARLAQLPADLPASTLCARARQDLQRCGDPASASAKERSVGHDEDLVSCHALAAALARLGLTVAPRDPGLSPSGRELCQKAAHGELK